jgi:hypothetical protein
MRGMIRSLGVVGLALLSVVGLVIAWTAATVVQLTATALIMGGTGHPLSTPPDDPVGYISPYMSNAINGFINPAFASTGPGGTPIDKVATGDDRYAVITPEQFFPVSGMMTFDSSVTSGLANVSRCIRGSTECSYNPAVPGAPTGTPDATDEFVVFGYSQSAVVASLLKKDIIENPDDYPDLQPGDVSFFLLSNPMRPNGGVLARGPEGLTIPIIGITFHGATPTDSCNAAGECYDTVDVAAQYDGLGGDAPASITNLLAIANAVAGYYYFHGDMQNASLEDAEYQGSHGDTDYYLVRAQRLPILMPFESFVPSPILTLLEAPLKAAIEAGYARDVNPGVATKVGLLPFRDPVQAIVNILKAIPVGIDDAIAEASGDPQNRPLGTAPVTSPFGVGGPELPEPPVADGADANLMFSRAGGGPVAQQDVGEQVIGEEGAIEENHDENADEQIATGGVQEEIIEEQGTEGQGTEKLEATTPRVTPKPVARFGEQIRSALDKIRLPKIRGPISFDSQKDVKPPSAAQPGNGNGNGDTTTGEQDSPPASAGEAAA